MCISTLVLIRSTAVVHLCKEFANPVIIRALREVGHVKSRLPSEMNVYLMVMHALLILRKRRGYTISCKELDGGDQHVRQVGDFNFANNTTLIIRSDDIVREVNFYRRL